MVFGRVYVQQNSNKECPRVTESDCELGESQESEERESEKCMVLAEGYRYLTILSMTLAGRY